MMAPLSGPAYPAAAVTETEMEECMSVVGLAVLIVWVSIP